MLWSPLEARGCIHEQANEYSYAGGQGIMPIPMALSVPAAHTHRDAIALKCGLTHPAQEIQLSCLSVSDSSVPNHPHR